MSTGAPLTRVIAWLGAMLSIALALTPGTLRDGAARKAATAESVIASSYESHNHAVVLAQRDTERGPPASYGRSLDAYDAVGRWSYGAAARPDASATSASYVYGDTARSTHPAFGSRADEERVGGTQAGLAVAAGWDVAANTATDGVSLSLRYKDGWSAAQKAAADGKVAALNDAAQAGGLRVTAVERSGTSASSRYRSAGGTVPRGSDVDHTIDLQLCGLDEVASMSPLDLSVNRSLGSQIMWQLRGVQPGTCVISVMIC